MTRILFRILIFHFFLFCWIAGPASGLAANFCPPLPPAAGTVVPVATVSELVAAVNNAAPGTTILLADGIYALNGAYLRIDVPDVTLRSAGGTREAVILDGAYQTTEIIQITASRVTVADLTLRRATYHPIHVMSTDQGDTLQTLIYNLHIVDPGEQAIKINPYTAAGARYFPDYGTVACSHIELTNSGRPQIGNDCYTGGIDAHQARGWVVRDNRIEGFWCPQGLSEHAVHFWRASRDTLIERNDLRNNARGIGLGLATEGDARVYPDSPCPTANGGYLDHYGGLVRNNFVFAGNDDLFGSEYGFDCGLCLWQVCGARVLHNTVASTRPPFSSIEWRFDRTRVELANNLATHNLRDRGGTAYLSGNLENQPLTLFADGGAGDLHLAASAAAAVDKVAAPSEAPDDIDGDPRPTGLLADVGADEFDFSGDPAPQPANTARRVHGLYRHGKKHSRLRGRGCPADLRGVPRSAARPATPCCNPSGASGTDGYRPARRPPFSRTGVPNPGDRLRPRVQRHHPGLAIGGRYSRTPADGPQVIRTIGHGITKTGRMRGYASGGLPTPP